VVRMKITNPLDNTKDKLMFNTTVNTFEVLGRAVLLKGLTY